jgi:hypothetical protein
VASFELVLVALLIGQQAFYMWQVHTLLNKLMSRNYYDYSSSTKPVPERKMKPQDPGIPEDMGELDVFKIQL